MNEREKFETGTWKVVQHFVRDVTWVKGMVLVGAGMLLAGVLVFCHAELRGAGYIERMNAILDVTIPSTVDQAALDDATIEAHTAAVKREKLDELWDSFFREGWWASQVVAPIGAGILGAGLVTMAVFGNCRFSVRTLLFVMLYVAILVGIPFGVVRPRLNQAQVTLQTADDFRVIGLKFYQGSTRRGGGPRWSYLLVKWKTVLVAGGAFAAAGGVAAAERWWNRRGREEID